VRELAKEALKRPGEGVTVWPGSHLEAFSDRPEEGGEEP